MECGVSVPLEVSMAVAAWIVSDELWSRVEPLLAEGEAAVRYPGPEAAA
jgi:hypothetical protein